LFVFKVSKRDEAILSLQAELDATQQEYENCTSELEQRDKEVAERKSNIVKLEADVRAMKTQMENANEKVRASS
jgi:predicted  nucleic acid-binding Zn-ribbon protein